MSKRPEKQPPCTIADICRAMESIAPTPLAQSWDNVGLLAGDPSAALRRALLAIDLTRAVLNEAIESKAGLVIAYHPPIFKPLSSLRASGIGMEALVFECIRHGIAIYATHTALDAAEGGTNDVLASLCGATSIRPLDYVDRPGPSACKFVVFVPQTHIEDVSAALFAAGAGRIGEYDCCSFRAEGTGTFLGGQAANPAVGKKGRFEAVREIRMETIVPTRRLPHAVAAMRMAHPYEEPAFDIYPLKPVPVGGIGRVGILAKPTPLADLADQLHAATKAANVQVVGRAKQRIERVVVVAGAAGSLPFQVPLTPAHAIVTGEIRHHDALTVGRIGCAAVGLGHWASERPVLKPLADRISMQLPGVECRISRADADPFRAA